MTAAEQETGAHRPVYNSIDFLDSMAAEPECACGNDWPCEDAAVADGAADPTTGAEPLEPARSGPV